MLCQYPKIAPRQPLNGANATGGNGRRLAGEVPIRTAAVHRYPPFGRRQHKGQQRVESGKQLDTRWQTGFTS